MKKIMQISVVVVLTTLVVGCIDTSSNNNVVQKKKQLVVLLYDISGSTDHHSFLMEQDLTTLFKKVSDIGGGSLSGYHIKKNSLQQDPYRVAIDALDTLSYKDNLFLDDEIQNSNRKTITTFDQHFKEMVDDALAKFVKPKNESYTDVENALKLAKVDFEQPSFSKYAKTLIIISDLIEDLPSKRAESKNTFTVEYENDIKIILVRPSLSHVECIKGQQPIIVNTMADAINNL